VSVGSVGVGQAILPVLPTRRGEHVQKKRSRLRNNEELPKRVGIIYSDAQREYFATEAQYITEKDADKDAALIGQYLQTLGTKVCLYPGNARLPSHLLRDRPDIVINLVDSVKGDESLSSTIPGVLELLNYPYTGAGMLGLSLDTNKFLIKKLLQQNGVPIPNYQLFNTYNDYLDPSLRFPLISKLNAVHGSVEITRDAVSENEKHLRERLKNLIQTYSQSVLVEEYIAGREISAILLEGKNKKVYLGEKVFTARHDKYTIVTFEDQWISAPDSVFHYVKYEDPLLREYVKKAFDVTEMSDYGKFDIRLDQSGRYFFIDTNCNPAFGPKEMDVALSVILDLYGISFYEILKRLMLNTVRDATGKELLPFPTDAEDQNGQE
jgi:D-alanine-D-alanine ligase